MMAAAGSSSLSATLAQLAQQFAPPPADEGEDGDEQYVLLEFEGLAPDELRGELSLQAGRPPTYRAL